MVTVLTGGVSGTLCGRKNIVAPLHPIPINLGSIEQNFPSEGPLPPKKLGHHRQNRGEILGPQGSSSVAGTKGVGVEGAIDFLLWPNMGGPHRKCKVESPHADLFMKGRVGGHPLVTINRRMQTDPRTKFPHKNAPHRDTDFPSSITHSHTSLTAIQIQPWRINHL